MNEPLILFVTNTTVNNLIPLEPHEFVNLFPACLVAKSSRMGGGPTSGLYYLHSTIGGGHLVQEILWNFSYIDVAELSAWIAANVVIY